MKLVHDSNSPEAVAERHAADMKELLGRMLQVGAGGGGIDKIGDLLERAAQSFDDVMGHPDLTTQWHAGQAVQTALQPDFPEYRGDRYDCFAANKAEIVRYSLRIAAHHLLDNNLPKARAETGLFEIVKRMMSAESEPSKISIKWASKSKRRPRK